MKIIGSTHDKPKLYFSSGKWHVSEMTYPKCNAAKLLRWAAAESWADARNNKISQQR